MCDGMKILAINHKTCLEVKDIIQIYLLHKCQNTLKFSDNNFDRVQCFVCNLTIQPIHALVVGDLKTILHFLFGSKEIAKKPTCLMQASALRTTMVFLVKKGKHSLFSC